MANLKEIRTRISSVKKTRQVTSAMKMVSAAKLKKAQVRINRFLPYAEKQKKILAHLSQNLEESRENAFSIQRKGGNILIVVISSNKGLCGTFNANVVKKLEALIKEKYREASDEGRLKIITLGKKAWQLLRKTHNIVSHNEEIYDELTYPSVAKIAKKIKQDFADEKYDQVELIYNHSKTAGSQTVITEQYLPVTGEEEEDSYVSDYILEPSSEEIVEKLTPLVLNTQLYKALIDSEAAEHAARMIAMNKATDNAGDLLRELNLVYNKARQSAITSEILEIVSGAEALEND